MIPLETLKRALDPIWDAVRSMVSRCVVRNSDAGPMMQTVQVDLGHGDLREAEHFEPYGITARPLEKAEGLYVSPGGRSQPGVVLAVADRRYRVTGLQKGEVAIYTDEGVAIKLGRNNLIEITGATVRVDATAIELEAAASVDITAGTAITLAAPAINLNSA